MTARTSTAVIAVIVLGACAGAAPPIRVPERATTAGDALLARLPPGAAIVLEVDVARLRANAVVGAVVAALIAPPPDPSATPSAAARLATMTDAPLAGARVVVLAAYAVGTPAASTITIVDGDHAPAHAVPLADGVWALAAEGDTARLLAVAAGGPSLADDRVFAVLRAQAMPAAADGAAIRLSARLDDDARRELATVLGLPDAPAAISAWLDVADDLALIAWIGGEPRRWATVLIRLRDRVAPLAPFAALGLTPPLAAATIRRERSAARLTIVVPPARLQRTAARALEHLRLAAPAADDARVGSPR